MPAPRLADLARLRALRSLMFSGVEFDPGSLATLRDLGQVETLMFRDCRGLTDEGLRNLAALTGLRQLSFYTEDLLSQAPVRGQRISDAGVTHLKGLVLLESLDLFGHDLSDASVPQLAGMTELRDLGLSGRRFTDTGLEGVAPGS